MLTGLETFMHTWRIVLFHPLLCATYVLCDQFCLSSSHYGSRQPSSGPMSGDMQSVGNCNSAEHARFKFWLTMSPVVLEQVGAVCRRSSVCSMARDAADRRRTSVRSALVRARYSTLSKLAQTNQTNHQIQQTVRARTSMYQARPVEFKGKILF